MFLLSFQLGADRSRSPEKIWPRWTAVRSSPTSSRRRERRGRVDRVVVSTEDDEIARVARDWGAEVPFRRPDELATDDVSIIPVIQHAMQEMDQVGFRSEAVISLQPTSPFLEGEDIDRTVLMLEETRADSVVSVQPIAHEHPFWVRVWKATGWFRSTNTRTNRTCSGKTCRRRTSMTGASLLGREVFSSVGAAAIFVSAADVRAIVLGGWKSVHVDDEHHLELVRVMMKRKGSESD